VKAGTRRSKKGNTEPRSSNSLGYREGQKETAPEQSKSSHLAGEGKDRAWKNQSVGTKRGGTCGSAHPKEKGENWAGAKTGEAPKPTKGQTSLTIVTGSRVTGGGSGKKRSTCMGKGA